MKKVLKITYIIKIPLKELVLYCSILQIISRLQKHMVEVLMSFSDLVFVIKCINPGIYRKSDGRSQEKAYQLLTPSTEV